MVHSLDAVFRRYTTHMLPNKSPGQKYLGDLSLIKRIDEALHYQKGASQTTRMTRVYE